MDSNVHLRFAVAAPLLLTALSPGAAGCSDDDPFTLKIETAVPPAYLAVRDHGAAEWRTLAVAGTNSFEVEVASEHEVVILCDRGQAGGERARILDLMAFQRTRDDGATLQRRCPSDSGRVTVSGRLQQGGQLLFGPRVSSHSRGGDFSWLVAPGTYDLLILDASGPGGTATRAGLRRGIAVTGDTSLGVIDQAQEPMRPLVSKTFSASNARPDEALDGSFLIRTAGITTFPFDPDGDGTTIKLLPDELLLPTDRQSVSFTARVRASDTQPQSHLRSRVVDAKSDAAIELPELPGAVVFEVVGARFGASWDSVPESDTITVFLSTPGSSTETAWGSALTMSQSFAAATGAKALALDVTTLPGWNDEWTPRPLFGQDLWLAASEGELGEVGSAVATVVHQFPDQ